MKPCARLRALEVILAVFALGSGPAIAADMPPETKRSVLSGTVVDSSGNPFPNLQLRFIYGSGEKARSFWVITDEKGAFAVEVLDSGEVTVGASIRAQIEHDGYSEGWAQECRIVGNDTLRLSASEDQTIALVVAKPESPQSLFGRVVDSSGYPVVAHVALIYGGDAHDSVVCHGDGKFAFGKLPAEPFLLEVRADGCKARVLRSGEGFHLSEEGLKIVLEAGPFAYGDSVWASVTGTPPTQESVDAYPEAEYVRRQEWTYYQSVKPRVPGKRPYPSSPRTYPPKMRVVDEEGNPVKRILIASQLYAPGLPAAVYKRSTADKARPKSSDTGVYDVPADRGIIVSAPGMGRVLVTPSVRWSEDPNATFDVVLRKAASLDLKVMDSDRRPLPNVPVYAGLYAWEKDPSCHIADTDGDGVLKIEGIVPGFHGIAVGKLAPSLQLLLVELEPGEKRVERVILGTDDAKQRSQALLQCWREVRRPRTREGKPDRKLTAEVAALSKHERSELRKRVRANLDLLPGDLGTPQNWIEREIRLHAALAVELENGKAVPGLKRLLRESSTRGEGLHWISSGVTGALVEAIITLEGERALGFFVDVAGEPAASRSARVAAVLAFGRLGTPKSAETFGRLRDAAYALPNVPQPKDSYTHSERMAEAAHMALCVIPCGGTAAQLQPFDANAYSMGSVSEDYLTGRMSTTIMDGWTDLHFRRVADEWLLERVGTTISPP